MSFSVEEFFIGGSTEARLVVIGLDEAEHDLFIQLNIAPPMNEVVAYLVEEGISWELWEGRPMADQIKLHSCRGAPLSLPTWLRRKYR